MQEIIILHCLTALWVLGLLIVHFLAEKLVNTLAD